MGSFITCDNTYNPETPSCSNTRLSEKELVDIVRIDEADDDDDIMVNTDS